MGGSRNAILGMSFSAVVLLGAGDPATSGSPSFADGRAALTGRVVLLDGEVRFVGTAPAESAIDMSADGYCREQHGAPVMRAEVRVASNGGLGGVLIRVTDAPRSASPAAGEVMLDQVGCLYTPGTLAVRVGQDLVIRNSDATLHNVRVEPTVNRGFNLGQPIQGIQSSRSFDEPEIGIPVRCDIHGWMTASIHVLDHEFFDVSADDGSFALPPLPPGDYEIEAWHPTLGTASQTVSVSAASTPELSFEFTSAD